MPFLPPVHTLYLAGSVGTRCSVRLFFPLRWGAPPHLHSMPIPFSIFFCDKYHSPFDNMKTGGTSFFYDGRLNNKNCAPRSKACFPCACREVFLTPYFFFLTLGGRTCARSAVSRSPFTDRDLPNSLLKSFPFRLHARNEETLANRPVTVRLRPPKLAPVRSSRATTNPRPTASTP